MERPVTKRPKIDSDGLKESVEVGIIGMGDMGRLYASKLVEGGWR